MQSSTHSLLMVSHTQHIAPQMSYINCLHVSKVVMHVLFMSSCECYPLHILFCYILHLDYQPALSLASYRTDFTERLSAFTYSFQESCSLYPRCTSYFSVEHTVSPLSVVSTTSSGCTVEYTISNLERCRTYHSTATALLGNRQGNTIVVRNTVMLSE